MIDTALGSPSTSARRIYDFDEIPVSLTSSSIDVVDAIERMMTRHSHSEHDASAALSVTADAAGDAWQIFVDGHLVRSLPRSSAEPYVAEELIAAACCAAASRRRSVLMRGAILERNNRGLAVIGEDLDSVKALALHLHARHWTAISFGYSFLNPHSLEVVGLQSLAVVSSTSIDQIPRRYRRAIEASKWYDSGYHLTFYAVDPFLVHPGRGLSTTLNSVVVIDGAIGEIATIDEALDAIDLTFLANHPQSESIRIAKMTLSTPIASCDAIEKWFSSSRVPG